MPVDWKDGQDVVLLALVSTNPSITGWRPNAWQDTLGSLDRDLNALLSDPEPTLASLVLIVHAPLIEPFLVSAFPVILTSIQCNIGLDSSLVTLLRVLCVTQTPQTELPAHIIVSLTVLRSSPIFAVHTRTRPHDI